MDQLSNDDLEMLISDVEFDDPTPLSDFQERDVLKALKELKQLRTERTWQPIETAPRDGEVILIDTGRYVFAAFYKKTERRYPWVALDPDVIGEDEGLNGFEDNAKLGPVRWMPLPTR